MLLPEGDEHRLQRLELGQFLPAHDLDDRLPLPLAAGKGRRVGRGGELGCLHRLLNSLNRRRR